MKSNSTSSAQAMLLRATHIALSLYETFIKSFTVFNTKYKPDRSKNALKVVDSVVKPSTNEEIQAMIPIGYHSELKASSLNCTDLRQFLSEYIDDIYAKEEQVAAKKQIGSLFYTKEK